MRVWLRHLIEQLPVGGRGFLHPIEVLVKGSLLQCRYVATFEGLVTMSITKLSSRDFNQDTSRAKRAAKRGPVFITDRGRPSHVLLTVEEYQKITGGQKSIIDLLAMPAAAEIEFEPPRLRGNLHEPAELT